MSKKQLVVKKSRQRPIFITSFGQGVNTILDDAILPNHIACMSYNFSFESGVLKDGFGIDSSQYLDRFPIENDQVQAVWQYQKREPNSSNFLMVCTKKGDIYYRDLDSMAPFKVLDLITLTSTPNAVTYRLDEQDVCIITTATDGMWVWDGIRDIRKIEGVPNISSMTIHAERLFVTTPDQPDSIYFSDDMDPTNFSLDLSEGGYIEMLDERGMPLTTVSYQNYVYIFREYGISRLVAYGNQYEFSISNLFVSSGKIYPKTVCLCGDTVMFLASDGIYAFDGVSAQRVLGNLGSILQPSYDAVANYFEGKYYLSMRLDFMDEPYGVECGGYKNNALVVLDITDGSYSITRGIDITSLVGFSSLNQIVAITSSGEVGCVKKCGRAFGVSLKKVWQMGTTDFNDPSSNKRVRQIDIFTKGDIVLKCTADKSQKNISVKGSGQIVRVPINMPCKRWAMTIVSERTNCYIARPKIRVDIS